MVKRRFSCKLYQVIQTFTEFRYWKWASGVDVRLQERKTRSVQERQKRGSCGARSGGMASPCLHQRSADVERGGVEGRKGFVSHMGLNKNTLELPDNRKMSLN